jgi:GH24 family phage-related lysozyme (muramidase)
MANLGKISTNLPKAYNMDPEGKRSTWDKVYAGYVKDNKDAQYQGRLLVYIPELCGTDREEGWIICDYGSPFSGVTPVTAEGPSSGGQTSYGMWFVPPDVDNQVLVVFVNGDPNRGVWIACLPHVVSHKMTPAVPGSSAPTTEVKLNESHEVQSFPDIPFTVGITRQAGLPRNPGGGEVPGVTRTQNSAGTGNVPGLGNPSYSSHNSYAVGGISTPDGNRLVMSDAEGDTQIRLATRNNIQVILHNETGILSLQTGDGKSRVELHRDGRIIIYGESNINIRSKQDVNIHGDRNVNIQAGNEVQIKGDKGMRVQTGSGRMNFYSGENIHMTSIGDHHRFSNGHIHDTSCLKMYRFANFGIYDTSNRNIDTFCFKSITTYAREEINSISGSKTRIESIRDSVQVKAATTLTLFSSGDTNIKSDAKLNLQSKTDSNLLSGGNLNLDTAQEANLRAGLGTLNLESRDKNVNIKGAIVVIGPSSKINESIVPAAGAADGAADPDQIRAKAILSEVAEVAKTPDAVNTVEISPNSRGAGGGGGGGGGGGPGQTVTSSIAGVLPGAEPDQSRFLSSAGFSNTNIIVIDETQAENVRIGQIATNQATPLQTLGFISSGATIGESGVEANNLGVKPQIYEAVQAIRQTYPKAKLGNDTLGRNRVKDSPSHRAGNAVDFDLAALSQTERARLMNEIATGIRTGVGPYRFIRGVGQYDLRGLQLHIDCRTRNESRVSNGIDAWGPSGSITSALPGKVPDYFLSAMQIRNGKIGLVPGNPQPQTPAQPGTPAPANSDPLRWIGTAYEANGAPRYRQEDLPDYVFKTADQWSLSEVGLTDIKNFETLKGPDSADLPGKQFKNVCKNMDMIGYGHKLTDQEKQDKKITIEGRSVDISDVISEEDAFKLLKQDVKAAETAVKNGITVPINQQQFDVLVDFCWNIGEEKFKESNLFKFVNERKFNVVTTEFIKWCKVSCDIYPRAELRSRRRANALKWAGIMRPETPVAVSSAAAAGQASTGANPAREAEAMAWFQSSRGGFQNQGFTREQAAGIVGNLLIEAPGLDPRHYNAGEQAVGIAQWTPTGGRSLAVARFLGLSNAREVTNASFQDQLRAITNELNTTHARAAIALRRTATVDEATIVVFNQYEVANARTGNLTGRKAHANRVLGATRN